MTIVFYPQPANAVANIKKVVYPVGETVRRPQLLRKPARCAALHRWSERDPSASSICSSAGSMAILMPQKAIKESAPIFIPIRTRRPHDGFGPSPTNPFSLTMWRVR